MDLKKFNGIKLRNSKLLPYFKEVITSEAVGVKKPDPRIFQFALEKLMQLFPSQL